ncbi:sigma-70 family RNA polymerase sigma factor [Lysinibacter cavernae]|uniref:RNA polymerase sigma factor (Sigma-70 family) n=1 Tax=Lysinibacter cavernae TaxID=1640652 RepID=A0A7X5R1K7_9MICO|nr:RNA polymerase sigma factor (sigma-70 family) [Lysinibacter cavernae]
MRDGDTQAFSELWARHEAFARRLAAAQTTSFEADDLVSESFTRIYKRMLDGGGPHDNFRPYLYVTVRNLVAEWGRALREFTPRDDQWFAVQESTAFIPDDFAENQLVAEAFASLPERWQKALFHTEIEGLAPSELGTMFGMSSNAAHQLTFRARDGLRAAWVQAHIPLRTEGSECRWATERMGSYERDRLSHRERVRLEKHVVDCSDCLALVALAEEVGSRLRVVLLPLIGAGGLVASLWQSTPARASAVRRSNDALTQPQSGSTGWKSVCAGAGTAVLTFLLVLLPQAAPVGESEIGSVGLLSESEDGDETLFSPLPRGQGVLGFDAVAIVKPTAPFISQRLGQHDQGIAVPGGSLGSDPAAGAPQLLVQGPPQPTHTMPPNMPMSDDLLEQIPTYVMAFGGFTWPEPDTNTEDFVETLPMSLSNTSVWPAQGPLTIAIPDELNGYWTVSAVRIDGVSLPASLIVQSNGSTLFTISDPPDGGAATQLSIDLTYDRTSWPLGYVTQPDLSSKQIDRPNSAIVVTVLGSDGVSDASISIRLPGFESLMPPP